MTEDEIREIAPHFVTEVACKCGCGRSNVQRDLLVKLERMRTLIGRPLTINSMCRCEQHNEDVGGKPNSAHLYGEAADIAIVGDEQRYEVDAAAHRVGITRIGIGKYLVHVDVSKTKPQPRTWLY